MAMEMDHSFTVPVPPDQAWGILLDVERIAPCMPGASVDEVDGDVVNGRIKVKVGPVSLTYKGTAKFTERDADAHMVVLEASGKETRGAGTASATVRASMTPEGSGTEVTMHTSMNVTGRPAQFGRGVMVEVGSKLVEQFAKNLAQLISEGTGGSAGSGDDGTAVDGASVDGTSVDGTGVEGTGAPAATADGHAGSGSAGNGSAGAVSTAGASGVPAAVSTAGAGASAAATTTASAVSAPAEESLNLVKLVGPVLLKRLVPVIAGAAGVALIGRLVWRLRHRGRRVAKA